jgi:hypothetical protein
MLTCSKHTSPGIHPRICRLGGGRYKDDRPVPAGKSKEEQAVKITENILENTVIAEPIQITYLSSSSGEEEGNESNSNDGEHGEERMGSATKTELSGLPGENKWRVTIRKGGGQGNLLGPNYIILQQTYNNSTSPEQQQRSRQKKSGSVKLN